MSMDEKMILDRLREVSGLKTRTDLAEVLEPALERHGVSRPRRTLLTAASTTPEEQHRWNFMRHRPDFARKSIEGARGVVAKRLREDFDVRANWASVDRIDRDQQDEEWAERREACAAFRQRVREQGVPLLGEGLKRMPGSEVRT